MGEVSEALDMIMLVSVQVEEFDGIACQYCVALLFRHSGKLLLHQFS